MQAPTQVVQTDARDGRHVRQGRRRPHRQPDQPGPGRDRHRVVHRLGHRHRLGAIDGFPINEPFWGAGGSPNATDWYEVNFGTGPDGQRGAAVLQGQPAGQHHLPGAVVVQHPVPQRQHLDQRGQPGEDAGRAAGQLQPGAVHRRSAPSGSGCWYQRLRAPRPASPRSRSTTGAAPTRRPAAERQPRPVGDAVRVVHLGVGELSRRSTTAIDPPSSNDTGQPALGHLAQHRPAVGAS